MHNPCQIIHLERIGDRRGNLSVIEGLQTIPFAIKRVFWIYDVPGGAERGGHAYKESEELIIALSGSFTVKVDTGEEVRKYHLDRSYYGLYIPKRVWRVMNNFSTNSLALVLSSTDYNPDDYIWDNNAFKAEEHES